MTREINHHLGFTLSSCRRNADDRLYLPHTLYGDIPVLLSSTRPGFAADRRFVPRLPAGAVRADTHRQNLDAGSKSVTTWEPVAAIPRYYYLDQSFTCRDCRNEDVFGIDAQRDWYEELRLPTYIEMNRCGACREKRRAALALNDASRLRSDDSTNTELALARCEALLVYRETCGGGDLEEVIGVARRVAKASPPESSLHQRAALVLAKAHLHAGHITRAAQVLTELVACPPSDGNRRGEYQREGDELLASLPGRRTPAE